SDTRSTPSSTTAPAASTELCSIRTGAWSGSWKRPATSRSRATAHHARRPISIRKSARLQTRQDMPLEHGDNQLSERCESVNTPMQLLLRNRYSGSRELGLGNFSIQLPCPLSYFRSCRISNL